MMSATRLRLAWSSCCLSSADRSAKPRGLCWLFHASKCRACMTCRLHGASEPRTTVLHPCMASRAIQATWAAMRHATRSTKPHGHVRMASPRTSSTAASVCALMSANLRSRPRTAYLDWRLWRAGPAFRAAAACASGSSWVIGCTVGAFCATECCYGHTSVAVGVKIHGPFTPAFAWRACPAS